MSSTVYGPSGSEDNGPLIRKEPPETESSSYPYIFYYRRERRESTAHADNLCSVLAGISESGSYSAFIRLNVNDVLEQSEPGSEQNV